MLLFYLTSVDQMEMVDDTGLVMLFNKGNVEGTITLRKFVSDVRVCVFFI